MRLRNAIQKQINTMPRINKNFLVGDDFVEGDFLGDLVRDDFDCVIDSIRLLFWFLSLYFGLFWAKW